MSGSELVHLGMRSEAPAAEEHRSSVKQMLRLAQSLGGSLGGKQVSQRCTYSVQLDVFFQGLVGQMLMQHGTARHKTAHNKSLLDTMESTGQ